MKKDVVIDNEPKLMEQEQRTCVVNIESKYIFIQKKKLKNIY